MAFIFKIQIMGITKPPVWRRLLVPSHFTFARFHKVLQVAFGWEDVHLYKYSDAPYGGTFEIIEQSEEDEDFLDNFRSIERYDAEKLKLSDYFSESQRDLVYLYDFGDDWVHKIVLEEIRETEHPLFASCLKGSGACPPEDIGGPMGYEEMKRVFREEPESEAADQYAEWLWIEPEEGYDPKEFYLKVVNMSLLGV